MSKQAVPKGPAVQAPQEPEKPKFPTETVDLPSKGLLYPEGHPLKDGTIEIKYMTAREEDILTSSNLIQKGLVIDELLKSVIVTKVSFDDILIGDKNAIMLATRIFGYGKSYETNVTCPSCGNVEKDCEFDLTSLEYKDLDEEEYSTGNTFTFELPNSKRKVGYKYLTQRDETAIQKELERVSKHVGKVQPEVTTRLRYQIISVDGESDPKVINNFVQNELFAMDSRAFRENYLKSQPDVDFDMGYVCPECGSQNTVDLPISTNFFWPSR